MPKSLQKEVLALCHDAKTSGHLGRDKTLARLRKSFHWYHMNQDCSIYVFSCATCSLNKKASRRARAAQGKYHAGFPMERVHLDVLGPFTTSASGNTYILTMIDQFTKWVECAPIPAQSADIIAHKFLVHFVTTFGCPLEVHSDQGQNFTSNLFKAFCHAMGIAKTRTTPYRPCSNGQIERQHRTIMQMVRCLLQKDIRTWDEDLPFITMALHSMVHKATGYSANQMMLGREVILPQDLIMNPLVPAEISPDEWVQKLREKMSRIHHEMRKRFEIGLERQKKLYDLRIHERIYHEGDLVYLREHTTKKGESPKLRPMWKGPYLVVESSPPLYKVKTRKREVVMHHDNLKLCKDRYIPIWLRRARNKYLGQEIDDQIDLGDYDEIIDLRQLFQQNPLAEGIPLEQKQLTKPSTTEIPPVQDLSKGTTSPTPLVTTRGRISKRPHHLQDYVS